MESNLRIHAMMLTLFVCFCRPINLGYFVPLSHAFSLQSNDSNIRAPFIKPTGNVSTPNCVANESVRILYNFLKAQLNKIELEIKVSDPLQKLSLMLPF